MEYNTQRKKMMIPEYGRNIQKMIDFVVTVEDRDQRNQLSKYIMHIMANMNPTVRETSNYKQKLWDHMHAMSNFKLDIEGPFPKPEPQTFFARPKKIPYSDDKIKYRHYGKNIEMMVQSILEMEEGEEKTVLVKILANHMKKSYLNWNRDSVSDLLIFKQLEELSGGKLKLTEDEHLTASSELITPVSKSQKKKKYSQKNSNNGRRRNYSQKY